MNKRFIRTTLSQWKNVDASNYFDSIVFIEDSKLIYTNGVYYNSFQGMIETTYLNLKELKNNLQLIPGQEYRIIDYKATSIQENTECITNNYFDIIVTANSDSELNERAKACPSEGSIYYNNNKLHAWEVWYCLENDTNRFAWADENYGKGVIYRLIDEFGNDIPFDFKSIKTYSEITTLYHYLFPNTMDADDTDYSLTGNVIGNKINPYIDSDGKLIINNIFISQSNNSKIKNNYIGYNVDNIHIVEMDNTDIYDNCIGNNNSNIHLKGINIINYNITPNTNNNEFYELLEIDNSSHIKFNIAKKSNNNIVVYNEADLIAG